VTPTLPAIDMDASVEFYEAAGFEVRVYEGGGFAFVTYDACCLMSKPPGGLSRCLTKNLRMGQ